MAQQQDLAATRTEALRIGRAQAGDVDAFTALVVAHQTTVLRWLVARCPPGVDAEDLAQQAFLVAWERIDSYQGTAAFASWVIGIAANLLRRECRRLQRRSRVHDLLARETLAQVVEAPGEPAEDLVAVELRLLERCLAELDPKLDEVVGLHYEQNRPIAVIASHLARPVGTVKRQLFQARQRLAECVRQRLAHEERVR